MKTTLRSLLILAAALCPATPLHAEITAFSYSGQLNDAGVPANGSS